MSIRLVVALAGLASFAVQALEAPPVGDAQAGAEKAAVCGACHGLDGNSANPAWPKLAGQHADYTYRQTRAVRDGEREIIEMTPFVAGLSDQDIADMAAYFAGQTIVPGLADDSAIDGRDDTYAGLGARLYRGGKPEAGVPACLACHGPSGRGIPGAGYPALAGQHGEYTRTVLERFHAGIHYGGADHPSTQMVAIARGLDETEIAALATYVEGLHRADPAAAAAARRTPVPAAVADPAPAAAEAQPVAEPGT
ncbi:MAG: cytochrome c4 [Xanthomonadales bacterium]|nr:cytochrome c4 [Xanthomonadales bacterium]